MGGPVSDVGDRAFCVGDLKSDSDSGVTQDTLLRRRFGELPVRSTDARFSR